MYAEIEQPLQIISNYIKDCIGKEVNPDGLLHDIKSYKTIYRDDLTLNTPAVWLYMDTWEPTKEQIVNRSNTRIEIAFPVEVACITHKKTLAKSDEQATSIQARIIESFIKNWKRKIDDENHIICNGFNLLYGYTDGNIPAVSQRETVTIKGVLIEFKFSFDWMRCIHLYNKEKENEEITNNENNDNENDIGGVTNG